jgi:hypothetical protein
MRAKPLWDLPCLPSNDYYQWPATIIFVLIYFYHNILINVKKKYYMWYIHALISDGKLPSNQNGIVKNECLLTKGSEIVQYGFIRSILCLLLNLKAFIGEFFGVQEQKADENKNTNDSLGCADDCAFFIGYGRHRFDRTGKIDPTGGSHCCCL